jgi:hypothetical protein
MASRALERSEWCAYFDHVSKGLISERAEVEVSGLALGDKTEARWLPLIGVTYDFKDDFLEIAMEGLDHLIHRPCTISVNDGAEGLESMEIFDADRHKQIVKLMKPLRYPRRVIG